MLVCRDAASEMEFCKIAFGGVELARRLAPDGTVVHATLTIGGAMIMIHGEFPTLASRAPQAVNRALGAQATVLLPVANQPWGDRVGRIIDPAGHVWNLASRVEESSSALSRNAAPA